MMKQRIICSFFCTMDTNLPQKKSVSYEAVSDQGPVWVQSGDKIPWASKSNFEVEIFISLVSLLP